MISILYSTYHCCYYYCHHHHHHHYLISSWQDGPKNDMRKNSSPITNVGGSFLMNRTAFYGDPYGNYSLCLERENARGIALGPPCICAIKAIARTCVWWYTRKKKWGSPSSFWDMSNWNQDNGCLCWASPLPRQPITSQ